MSSTSDLRIIFLFEDELRLAAKALRHANEEAQKKGDSIDQDVLTAAFQACWVALYDLTLDGSEAVPVTVMSKPMFKGPKRIRKKP